MKDYMPHFINKRTNFQLTYQVIVLRKNLFRLATANCVKIATVQN